MPVANAKCFFNTRLNVFKKLFTNPDLSAMETLRSRIRKELESKHGIKIVQG